MICCEITDFAEGIHSGCYQLRNVSVDMQVGYDKVSCSDCNVSVAYRCRECAIHPTRIRQCRQRNDVERRRDEGPAVPVAVRYMISVSKTGYCMTKSAQNDEPWLLELTQSENEQPTIVAYTRLPSYPAQGRVHQLCSNAVTRMLLAPCTVCNFV